MGIAGYLVTSTVNDVLAQRLVRQLCPHCREPYRPLAELVRQIGIEQSGEAILYRAAGCDACRGTGYRGRTVVTEILTMTDPLRRLVLDGGDARALRQAAVESGMRTMYADGALKALAGITSIEEVMRVTSDN
jgi:general secretion pathway protein E